MDAPVEGDEDKAFEQFVDDHLAGQNQGNSKGEKKVGRETHGPVCVSFEGNIGVGKSTILKLLHSHPRLHQYVSSSLCLIWAYTHLLNAISSSQWVAFTRKSQSLYHFFLFTTCICVLACALGWLMQRPMWGFRGLSLEGCANYACKEWCSARSIPHNVHCQFSSKIY